MVARICKYQGLGQACLLTTVFTTVALSPSTFAGFSSASCDAARIQDTLFSEPDCAVDRSAPAMHGPFQFIASLSDKTGYTFDPKYINDIGPADALSLEFAFGERTFRASSTWGHALTYNDFFKVTAEWFAQNPDFLFFAGEQSEWIGQWDFGGDVRHRFPGLRGLDSVHIGIQYSHADSKRLPNMVFNGGANTNIRHIRGGEELGGVLGVRIHPWRTGYLDLDLYYDENQYNQKLEAKNNAIGFGGGAAYHQNIGERFQFVLSGTDRRPYYEYILGFRWIAKHSVGSLLEMNLQFSVDGGDVPFAKENVVAVGIFYSWGGDMYSAPVIYNDPLNRGVRQELVDYTNDPAVRPPQVYAAIDQLAF